MAPTVDRPSLAGGDFSSDMVKPYTLTETSPTRWWYQMRQRMAGDTSLVAMAVRQRGNTTTAVAGRFLTVASTRLSSTRLGERD
jgi:hypothetical protein